VSVVLDASAALAWVFERENPKEAAVANELLASLSQNSALVPGLWHCEVANALLVGERRGVIGETDTADFSGRLNALPIETDSVDLGLARVAILRLAREFQLSSYDASYLELAIRRGALLATFDQRLLASARAAGVRVFGMD
jgi:predicted nucleic acid-binding protein